MVELLREMNKRGDNGIADGIMGSIRRAHGACEGSYGELVHLMWRQIGLRTEGCRFVDGSGLSRSNRLTPRFLVGLLTYMRTQSPEAGAFVHTLPIAGSDGTLRVRMTGTCAAGNIRAKTGFLTGASTLSGYVDTCGQQLCFSIMMNNYKSSTPAMRQVQNSACVAMAAWCRR